jgi:hypothetical protein
MHKTVHFIHKKIKKSYAFLWESDNKIPTIQEFIGRVSEREEKK